MIRQEERLDALERNVEELLRLNLDMPIVVEGKRDVAALRQLGLTGEILTVNEGVPLIEFCDRLAARTNEAVLLPDWDRTGGNILRRLRDNLRGRVKMHRDIRKTFAVYAEVHDVESLPAYLGTLRRKVVMATRDPRGTHDPRDGA